MKATRRVVKIILQRWTRTVQKNIKIESNAIKIESNALNMGIL